MASSSTSVILSEASKANMITYVKQDYRLLIDLLAEADSRRNVTHNVASAFLEELQSYERSYVSEEDRFDVSSARASINSSLETVRRFVEIKRDSMDDASLQQKSIEELRVLYLEIQSQNFSLA